MVGLQRSPVDRTVAELLYNKTAGECYIFLARIKSRSRDVSEMLLEMPLASVPSQCVAVSLPRVEPLGFAAKLAQDVPVQFGRDSHFVLWRTADVGEQPRPNIG